MIVVMTEQSAEPNLTDIAGYTAQIRHLQDQRALVAEQRRKAVIRHHNDGKGVSLAAMARAMGVSEAAVNKMVHGGPSQKAVTRTAAPRK